VIIPLPSLYRIDNIIRHTNVIEINSYDSEARERKNKKIKEKLNAYFNFMLILAFAY
jgi:hypothetical protein